MQYYYLVSSLPSLKISEEPLIKVPEFIESCMQWLSGGDMEKLSGAGINEPFAGKNTCDVLDKWESFENNLRNTLVSIRAKNLSVDAKHYTRDTEELIGGLETKVSEIASMDSPLAAEKKLLELRWGFLDELEAGYHFELGFLVVYYLKLQLLERLSIFKKEAGTAKFNEYENLYNYNA